MYFFAFTVSRQMYCFCTSTASAVWIYQSSKSHNTWVNLNPLMNAKPRHKEVIYIIMNTNEYVLQDDYIPCTYKLFWRHKLLRNKGSCVSLTNFFLRNELEYSIIGLLFCESVYSDEWIWFLVWKCYSCILQFQAYIILSWKHFNLPVFMQKIGPWALHRM